jgi:hypothetical protein
MNRKALWPRVLLSLSAAYMVLVAASTTALFLIPVFPTFMDGDRMASGCYITEAFLAGASCHGFWGSDMAGTLLQIPFVLVLGPIFGLGALASGDLAATIRGAIFLGISVSLWAPLVYLVGYLRRATQAELPGNGP